MRILSPIAISHLNILKINNYIDFLSVLSINSRIDFVENMDAGINKIRTLLKKTEASLPEFQFGNFCTIFFLRTVLQTSGQRRRKRRGNVGETSEKTSEKTVVKTVVKTVGNLW